MLSDVLRCVRGSEVRRVGAPHVSKRAGGEAIVLGLDGMEFASLTVRGARAGWSRRCEQCGYTRNIYNVKSGLDADVAQRCRLVWFGALSERDLRQYLDPQR